MAINLLYGMVWETKVESYTGEYLYSDFARGSGEKNKDSSLNTMAKIPFIGIVAGVARVVLGVIHTLGHLFAAAVTGKKGHLFHAAKGACEILRGVIEAIPIAGRIFANLYNATNVVDDDEADVVDDDEVGERGRASPVTTPHVHVDITPALVDGSGFDLTADLRAPTQNVPTAGRSWWMIKIYNPDKPDGLDAYMNNWSGWLQTPYHRLDA